MARDSVAAAVEALRSKEKAAHDRAYVELMKATAQPVDWAYQIWDDLTAALKSKDNRVRSIASQVLSNLAKSDPANRMAKTLPALLNVTKDDHFVTARHCMQSLWKVGVAGKAQQKKLVDGLSARFAECIAEKNCTLIRYDILVVLRKVYDEVKDDKIRQKSLALIETEADLKYRKKYARVWK